MSASRSAAGPSATTQALMPLVTSVNVACGFHAGDPSTLRRTCALAARPACRRCPGRLPGPGRFRPPVHRHRPRRADRRRHLPDRRAAGARPRRPATSVRYVKPHGALYNAHRSSSPAGARGRRSGRPVDPTCRCSACPGRCCWRGAEPPGCARCRRRSPTAATPRGHAGAPRANPVRCCTTRTRSPPGWSSWSPTA